MEASFLLEKAMWLKLRDKLQRAFFLGYLG
jgi:hypothetical protein